MEIDFLGLTIKVWELFAVIGVLLIIFEIFTLSFAVLPIGLAFLITAAGAVYLNSWLSVLLLLAINLIIMIWVVNKFVKRPRGETAKVDSMVGKVAEVIQEITPEKNGEVKLYGDKWVALSKANKVFEIGQKVKILEIDGNKVIVGEEN